MNSRHHGPSDMPSFIKAMANAVQHGKAVGMWGSFGEPGSGKSEWNLLVGNEIQKRLGAPSMQPKDLWRQLCFAPMAFPALAQKLPSLRTVFVDEGTGEGGHRRRAMSTGNVNLVMDLDACRGRRQPIAWANPRRMSVDMEVQQHMAWAFELTLDHAVTAYERDKSSAMFGGKPYFRERFTIDRAPWLENVEPDLRAEYLVMKDQHMAGVEPGTVVAQEETVAEYLPKVRALLR